MQFCRTVSSALGIILAIAAMPATAGWKNFFVGTNPVPSVDAPLIPDGLVDQELPQDDPIELPDPLTELNDVAPPQLGEEPLPLDLPVLPTEQLDTVAQTSSVPEPGTIALLALALLGVGLSRARRRERL